MLPLAMPPMVVVAAVGVEVRAEEVFVGVEVAVEVLVTVKVRTVRVVKVVRVVRARTRTSILATRLNVIQILPHSRPVSVTGPFVWSQEPVLGRIFMCQNQTNEVLTNSTEMT